MIGKIFLTGGEDVYYNSCDIRHLLATLSRLFHFRLSPHPFREKQLHSTRLFKLLLARHVKCHGKSYYILLDEQ